MYISLYITIDNLLTHFFYSFESLIPTDTFFNAFDSDVELFQFILQPCHQKN